jgi:glycosyltransferase involved in cell wall biosynthesis
VRITFVLPTVSMAGGIKVVVIYAQKLVQYGHIVKLVSPPPPPTPFLTKIRSLLAGNGLPVNVKCHPSQLDGARLDHTVLNRYRAVGDEDVSDGDVVIATWWETAEWVSRLSPKKGAKVYFIQHHEVFSYLPVVRSEATYRLPFHKIVVAQWLKELVEHEYSDFATDLVLNSVDHAQFFAPARGKNTTPTVGFLYSNATFKGLDVLLQSLALVRERVPELKFVAFGSEIPKASIFPKDIEFLYCPPQDQIRDIYARCDVWVTASRSEGFNLPAMEAMACRTPVVSTSAGWPAEAVKSGWNGVLVNVDDVNSLADGVEWVLRQTDDMWRALSSNAFATVAGSSWETSSKMFEQALVRARSRALQNEIAGGPSLLQT